MNEKSIVVDSINIPSLPTGRQVGGLEVINNKYALRPKSPTDCYRGRGFRGNYQ
jgi:hypothetical protein